MDIDLEELAAIIELLDKTEFSQFRFEKGDLRIAVSRGGEMEPAATTPVASPASSAATATSAPAATPAQAAPVQAAPVQAAPVHAAPSEAASAPTLADDEVLVRSPLLGTFYSSPKPGEAPYVQVGDKVDADATLCIVEVMKLMNSVTAGTAGEITRVLVSDGELVEFEQPLFVVRRLS